MDVRVLPAAEGEGDCCSEDAHLEGVGRFTECSAEQLEKGCYHDEGSHNRLHSLGLQASDLDLGCTHQND